MRDSYWTFIITLFIILPRLVSESIFRFTMLKTIWVFRIIDIFDIVLQTISLMIVVLYVYSKYIYGKNKEVSVFYLIVSMMLIGGHMMHFAANAIDMHFREVLNQDPSVSLPMSAYTLLHFLDEYLSHIIMFTALILIFSIGAIFDIDGNIKEAMWPDKIITIFSGIILGSGMGISVVEASIPIYMMVLTAICLASIVIYAKKHERKISGHVFCLYVVTIFTFLIISSLAYIAVFGFTSPRELIGSYLGPSK